MVRQLGLKQASSIPRGRRSTLNQLPIASKTLGTQGTPGVSSETRIFGAAPILDWLKRCPYEDSRLASLDRSAGLGVLISNQDCGD
jgi:hypothetical protein